MAGSVADQAFPQEGYRRSQQARLWQRIARRLALYAALVSLSAVCGGCSMSYQLGSLFGKDDDKSEATGSINAARAQATSAPSAELPPESDLAFARAAATDVLSRGGKDTSAPWENPKTGARGTVTPIATAYSQDGFVCRDFLASYVSAGTESWMQGEACRMHKGRWEVKALKPWKRRS